MKHFFKPQSLMLFPRDYAIDYKERIASSTLKIIPDAAHFVNVEQSGIFNAAILDFPGNNNCSRRSYGTVSDQAR